MRDYDPTTGRYLQADPLGLVDGASVYGYARQNPGRWVDPRGLCVGPLVIPCVWGGAAAADWVGVAIGVAVLGVGGATATGDATLSQTDVGDDCCQPLYGQINELVDELERRFRQWAKNRGGYVPGDKGYYGHVLQIFGKQQALRKKIAEAEAAGCFAYNPKAVELAYRQVPFPGRAFR